MFNDLHIKTSYVGEELFVSVVNLAAHLYGVVGELSQKDTQEFPFDDSHRAAYEAGGLDAILEITKWLAESGIAQLEKDGKE